MTHSNCPYPPFPHQDCTAAVPAKKERRRATPSGRCSLVAQMLRPTTLTAQELADVMPRCDRLECRVCPLRV